MLPVEPLTLAAFLPAALALNATPGADMMLCIGQGLRAGPLSATAASAGVALGVMVHATVAGLGLGAAIAAAPWAFDAIRWAGAGYLLWLAWRTLTRAGAGRNPPPVRAARAFREGLVVNLANPKVILFALAFIPQFVDASRAVLPQFLLLGAVLSLGGLVANALAGIFAGAAQARLAGSAGAGRVLSWLSAGIFALLAGRLIFMERA